MALASVDASMRRPVLPVCCNGPATDTVEVDLSLARFRAAPLPAPVCSACRGHALRNKNADVVAVSLLCVGVAIALMGVARGVWAIGAAGAVFVATLAMWLVVQRRRRLADTRDGHFPGLEMLASPRQISVRTPNRKLAAALAERHASNLYRII